MAEDSSSPAVAVLVDEEAGAAVTKTTAASTQSPQADFQPARNRLRAAAAQQVKQPQRSPSQSFSSDEDEEFAAEDSDAEDRREYEVAPGVFAVEMQSIFMAHITQSFIAIVEGLFATVPKDKLPDAKERFKNAMLIAETGKRSHLREQLAMFIHDTPPKSQKFSNGSSAPTTSSSSSSKEKSHKHKGESTVAPAGKETTKKLSDLDIALKQVDRMDDKRELRGRLKDLLTRVHEVRRHAHERAEKRNRSSSPPEAPRKQSKSKSRLDDESEIATPKSPSKKSLARSSAASVLDSDEDIVGARTKRLFEAPLPAGTAQTAVDSDEDIVPPAPPPKKKSSPRHQKQPLRRRDSMPPERKRRGGGFEDDDAVYREKSRKHQRRLAES